jgi:hypothetical protein
VQVLRNKNNTKDIFKKLPQLGCRMATQIIKALDDAGLKNLTSKGLKRATLIEFAARGPILMHPSASPSRRHLVRPRACPALRGLLRAALFTGPPSTRRARVPPGAMPSATPSAWQALHRIPSLRGPRTYPLY